MSSFIFDNSYYWEKEVKSDFFYNYIKVISHVKYSNKHKSDLLFSKHNPNLLSKR